ncbi:Maf family protein [Rheinheimera tilapiae]|jgi:MAF protein|uniref:7-methyl-GTP pyrophosphatase n=1 Tax=Rheinheimera tilapiae TaxID=875043 RepID=A0ABV6BC88_9GAMM
MAKSLWLASTSVYRQALLQKLTTNFQCAKPEVDETALSTETPEQLVLRLSAAKAQAVANRLQNDGCPALVIGSDQVAVFNGQILGKPHTEERAFAQLRSFSGQSVLFLTGLSVVDNESGRTDTILDRFIVEFRHLSDDEINCYIRREQPLNCAGSFKSEGLGITLFEKMTGDDPNSLIGLPLIRLHQMLKNFGVDLLLQGQ